LSVLLLGLAVLFQGYVSVSSHIVPELQQVRRLWALPPWERTALLLEGRDFLAYLRFLHEVIPEDARIILPPRRPPSVFSNIYYAQYFLFPRDLHNCGVNEVEACVSRATGPNTYILALDNFPPRDLASEHRIYIPFDGEIGVFAPPSGQGQ
jgi:hypothetical protein